MNYRLVLQVLAASLLLILAGSDATAQTVMRIVASNVTSGNGQAYETPGKNILKALAPDVCLMQEFNVGGANDTAAVNSFVSTTFGAGFYWYREAGAQIPNGVVSRWPIIASGEWDDPMVSNRDFAWARIDIPGAIDLYAVSLHLLTSSSGDRNLEATALKNYLTAAGIPANAYVVIGGDLNTGSRTEACITNLSSMFVTGFPWPVGQDGDPDTNAGRSSPYDWVIPNPNLNAIKSTTNYGVFSYTNGLVFDTRDYTQSQLTANFSPTNVSDSGASNMQHMAVVRTFTIPSSGPVTNGESATVTTVNRAPSTALVGSSPAMLSINVSTTGNDWDVGTVTFNLLGTAAQATIGAKVYLDSNNNGAVDAGETQLGSGSFSGGTTNIILNPPPRATSSSPARLLGVLSVLNNATSGSTVQLQLAANGVTHSSNGGTDLNPTFSATSSGVTTIVSTPSIPVVVGSSVVINKFQNGATVPADAVELLVVQDHLDMRGMIIKDFGSSMGTDGGGKYTFSTNALWSDLRAGTLIIIRNANTAADTNAAGDYKLDVGLANTTYFTSGGGTFDISGTEMVMIKSAGSGTSGVSGNIHTLGGGTAGSLYTSINTGAKLRAANGASGTTSEFVIVDNQGTGTVSLLSNFADGGGYAYGAVTTATLGTANGPANQDFITFLRGTTVLPADLISGDSFQANWNPLVTAASYRLDVATDAAFSNPVAGYYNVDVGSGTSATVSGLTGSSTYYFRVRGSNIEETPSGTSAAASVLTTSGIHDWSTY